MIAAMAAPIEALRNVPLFAGLDEEDLGQLARQLHERRFAEGAEVTIEGSTGAGFFVITEGNAEVLVGDEHQATLGPGDYFGEIALIDSGGVRSASIIAATDLQCYGLTPWEFRPFVEEHPQVAWALLQALASRYRRA
jgi:CRP/FNR family cyclic AMP-dependent transcriptional regulator